MRIFSFDLMIKKFELNFFTGESHADCSIEHTRQIRFKAEPVYDKTGIDGYSLKENDTLIAMPELVHVYFNNNFDQKPLNQCSYSPEVIFDEAEKLTSKFEICVDYNSTEFKIIWDMFSNPDKCTYKLRVSIKALEVESHGMEGINIIIPEDRTWELYYCSLDKVVCL